MKKLSINIHNELSIVANMLLLNGTTTECPGLVHGKIGIAIFFFHYAQYTKNMLFADYALDLIGRVQQQIHVNSSADYEKGIAGIGVGIHYMIINKFLITDDDICEDFDQRMFRAVMYDPWQDFSLYDGLVGYGRYWISRLNHQGAVKDASKCLSRIIEQIRDSFQNIPMEEQADVYCFLYDLQKISGYEHCNKYLLQCKRWSLNQVFQRFENCPFFRTLFEVQSCIYLRDIAKDNFDTSIKRISELNKGKLPASMGLLTGYAGEGLLRMTMMEQANNTWMFLL